MSAGPPGLPTPRGRTPALTSRGGAIIVGRMTTHARFAAPFLAAAMALPAAAALAQPPDQLERVAASFVLALGRTPSPAEIERWASQGPRSVADLLAQHRRELQDSAEAQRAVVARANQDAFGRASTEGESVGAPAGSTYVELMQGHLKRLAERPAEYEQVVHRAYQRVLRRDAYSIEIDYWKRRPTLSFVLLVGCVEDWARRNRPGLMATAGAPSVSVNSDYLAAVRLSPGVAREARLATGLMPDGAPALASSAGRSVVAPGAGQVASVGGIHFTAAGK